MLTFAAVAGGLVLALAIFAWFGTWIIQAAVFLTVLLVRALIGSVGLVWVVIMGVAWAAWWFINRDAATAALVAAKDREQA